MSHRFLIPLVFPGVGTEYSRKNQVREPTRSALGVGVLMRRRKRAA